MKKILLALLATVVGGSFATAQNVTPRVELGANFANMSFSGGDTPDIKVGFRAGAAVEVSLADGVYVAPGLLYRGNGFSAEGGTSATLHYLSIPVNLGYRAALTSQWAVSVEAGPYVAYGLGGNIKPLNYGKIDAFGDHGDLKRFEAGVGISAALEYERYFVRIGTDWGLTNVSKEGKVKNNDFYLGVGIRF